jgi:dTDP-4-amino-4,6-dideoxygalactose transaminase
MKPKIDMERYGAEAFEEFSGTLPNPFPRTIGQNAMKYLKEVVDSGLTCNMVGRFEQAFAKEMGVKHCIATPGCTPSLAVLAAAFGFDVGDEIIVSPITDYGTIQGLISENYIPVFADTTPETVNVSAETIEPCITNRTRAILVVHKTGIICDMDPINALAEKHGLIVYEDVCQAVFGEYKGRFAGALSKAGAFSFDSEKTMGSDIGGCIVTNDDNLAEQLRFVGQSRGAVMEPHFGRKHVVPGYAHRMTHCTAAICLAQLEIIRDQVAHIDSMVRLLTALVAEIPDVTPLPIPDYMNVYSAWMFGMSVDPDAFTCSAEEFAQQLAEAGIPGAGQGKYYLMPAACTFLDENARKKKYPYSMPPASREYSYSADTCPNARDFLENWIRWSTFCEKYQPEHCELAAKIIRKVAEQNRKIA